MILEEFSCNLKIPTTKVEVEGENAFLHNYLVENDFKNKFPDPIEPEQKRFQSDPILGNPKQLELLLSDFVDNIKNHQESIKK